MNKMTYEEWYNQLDSLCLATFGFGHEDMPDLTMIHDLFANGFSPDEAFTDCCDAWADDDPMFAELYDEGYF